LSWSGAAYPKSLFTEGSALSFNAPIWARQSVTGVHHQAIGTGARRLPYMKLLCEIVEVQH